MTTSARKEIEKLAKAIAKEAQDTDSLTAKIEAFKVLLPYYSRQIKAKVDEPEDGETTIEGIQRKLHIVEEQDGGTVHTRKRRS